MTGMVAPRSCVVAQIALELFDLGLTRAHDPEHIERRMRRTLRDLHLTARDCYVPILPTVLDRPSHLRRQREQPLRDLVRRRLHAVGTRWKCRGFAFKDAGWRPVSVVGTWASGQEQKLVVLTDLPVNWKVLRWYRRRFWIEAGFRQDKR